MSKREDLLDLVHLAQEGFSRLDVLFSDAGAIRISTFRRACCRQLQRAAGTFALSTEAFENALIYVLQQPVEVNIGAVTLRSTAQA